ncbi:hypothetical protein RHGRI_003250 [Rhododendron griersonianum]|uniref:DNA topoisomerase (ATP-hydrolyzing) n=1 Tax=Rhododendron griersonianum TaxID=479676 RepID=A0AAV6L5C2_9ERIC|nr:hypothetical protein RHGRI_003250 [Rhododendron griersonianum]
MWLCIPVMINLDVRSHRLESMFGYILHVHWQHRLVRLKIGILLLAYQGAIARWGCHLLIEYFHDLESHRKDIIWEDEQDGEAIELAFSKKKIEARKSWLRHFEPGTYLDQKEKLIKYSDFVNKELILFSMADLQRSIPSITSGTLHAQALTLAALAGAAVVEYYDHRTGAKQERVASFLGTPQKD